MMTSVNGWARGTRHGQRSIPWSLTWWLLSVATERYYMLVRSVLQLAVYIRYHLRCFSLLVGLFQKNVPPLISFFSGSLGFLTNFTLDEHPHILRRIFHGTE